MRIQPRLSADVRCAYCHGHLGPVFNRCPACRTALHLDCWAQLPTCPTLGCAGLLGAAPRPRRAHWVAWFPVAIGLLLLIVTALAKTEGSARPASPPTPLEAQAEMLRHVLEATESPEVSLRLGAVISLGKTGGEGAAVALARRIAHDSDVRVRRYAAEGLTRIQPQRAGRSETWSTLERALQREQNDDVRVALVQAWGFQRGFVGLRQLGPIVRQDPNRKVRLAAVRIVADVFTNTGIDDARTLLQRASNDRSWEVRQVAQNALEAAEDR